MRSSLLFGAGLSVVVLVGACSSPKRNFSDGPSGGAGASAGAGGAIGDGGPTGDGGMTGKGGKSPGADPSDAGEAGSGPGMPSGDAGGGEVPNCPELIAPTNGSLAATSRAPGAMAQFACSLGYSLVGADTLLCQSDGQWDKPAPSCTVKDCGALPMPAQGSVSVPATTYGSVATYSCPAGFGAVPGSTRTCQVDGTWSEKEPTCVPANCPSLAAPTGGTVSAPMLTYAAVATYSCATGYSISGSASRTCQPDGTWSGTAPTCALKDCGTLANPTNGAVSIPATAYGATAAYSCSTGYNLSGAATRTCQSNATWSGAAPTCVAASCGALSNPTNGTVSAPSTTFGGTATYACSTGYTLSGAATRSCQASGMWSGSAPSCAIVNCGALTNPSNGSVSAPTTTYGATATYSCSAGFIPKGALSRTCQANGAWSGAAPTCFDQANCTLKVANDTMALWPMSEGTGQLVHDLANGLDGTRGPTSSLEAGDPTWATPGRFSTSGLAFTWQPNTYVSVSNGYPTVPTGITVEAWVKPTDVLYHQIFTMLSVFDATAPNATASMSVALSGPPGGISWSMNDNYATSVDYQVPAAISLNTWHYVAVTFDGVTMKVYLDGVLIGSQLSNTVTMSAATGYYLGGTPGGGAGLSGSLGPVRLSSSTHTAAQIAAVWSTAAACPPQ